jgi:uncharacterized protein
MRVLRCAMVALAVAVASAGPALAQKAPADAARLAAAKEVMEASGTAKQFDAVMPMMFAQLGGAFSKVAPDKGSVIKEVMDKLLPKFSARKQELIDQIAELYAERFTTEELKAIVVFYKTPVGAKLVQSQAELMGQSMMLGQRWGQQIGKELEEETRKELKSRGITL